MAQELKTKSAPAIQHNSSNLAHHSALFRVPFETIRGPFEYHWRYGLRHRQILPVLPKGVFCEPPNNLGKPTKDPNFLRFFKNHYLVALKRY
jgi:hypothetical protein